MDPKQNNYDYGRMVFNWWKTPCLLLCKGGKGKRFFLDRSVTKDSFLLQKYMLRENIPTEFTNVMQFARSIVEELPGPYYMEQIFEQFPSLVAHRSLWMRVFDNKARANIYYCIQKFVPAELRSDR